MNLVDACEGLLQDSERLSLWTAALERSVRPGDTLLELGPGLLALAALKRGAGRAVVLCGPGQGAAAAELAAANDLEDRLLPFEGRPDRVDLPYEADLLVADPPPLDAGFLRNLDRCRRFLAPGGRTLPAHLALRLVPVDSGDLHDRHALAGAGETLGLDLEPASRLLFNRPRPCPDEPPSPWEPRRFPLEESHRSAWTAPGPCTVHGLAAWLEWSLDDGEPHRDPGLFFPLAGGLVLEGGQEVRLALESRPSSSGDLWSWGASGPSGSHRHCTLFGAPEVVAALAARGREPHD